MRSTRTLRPCDFSQDKCLPPVEFGDPASFESLYGVWSTSTRRPNLCKVSRLAPRLSLSLIPAYPADSREHPSLTSRCPHLIEEAREVLEAWKLNKKNESVFYNPQTGKPFVDLKNGFALACETAGIADVTWHTLRHTFASRLVNSGVDIVTVKELLGHSSISVTMRYAHTNIESKRAAVEKLGGFGDNLVTVSHQVHQRRAALSLIRPASYNVSRG